MNSSKVRTKLQLASLIEQDLSWRKKELIEAKKLLQAKSLSPNLRNFLLRSGISILYAHWEGFVKTAATAYVCFVAMQRLRYDELSTNFLALAARQKMSVSLVSAKPKFHIELVEFFLDSLKDRSVINWEKAINTQSNLNAEIFRDIVELLGLEYLAEYETKQHLIDEQLLANRNGAAHGESHLEFDIEGFLHVYAAILGDPTNRSLGLLDQFSIQIINAALLENYKKSIQT
jgi:hypothetical protein